jgi:hypothetical protein
MAPRIALAGRDRIDELRPLWLQLHHQHERVSRVQPFVDDATSWAVRRRSYEATFDGGGFALVAEDDETARRLYERRGLVPDWRQLHRVAAAR